MVIISTKQKNCSLAEQEKAHGEVVFIENDDNAAIRRLRQEAEKSLISGRNRQECYLILNRPTSFWLIQTIGLPEKITDRIDVFATTMEDLLAKTIFVKLPNQPTPFPPLDRVVISLNSEITIHLVIIGSSAQAEALAINAALVAHYPNYCKDTCLRTRITIIDDNVHSERAKMTQKYVHLFENSYYRTLDLNDVNPQCVLHRPIYEKMRKDFVDVEWEFINGNIKNEVIRQKMEEWSIDSSQQLTIAICHPDYDLNNSEALSLPEAVYKKGIPVLCYTEDDDILQVAANNVHFRSIYPFGSNYCNITTLRTLRQLAQRVNYVYNHCFSLAPGEPITAPSYIREEDLEEQWAKVGSLPKQYSNIFNAMTLGTKMHSIGHTSEDWEAYYALTLEEINILSEVEHNRWCVEELILGYRPVNEKEKELVEQDIAKKKIFRTQKIHYDLRAFDDLQADCTGKNVNVYDMALTQGIPLIIKTCITN